MGTLTGTALVNRARRILQDQATGGTRWLDAELLDWINDAQREIVLLKPNSKSVTSNVQLITGTKQTLPPTGIQLLDVIRNANGPAITRVEREIMDAENRNWHISTANATVIHYVFSEDAPDTYYVYPPQPGSGQGQIEIVYSAAPVDLVALSNTIDVNDIYSGPIVDYILYRSYSKDTEYAGNDQRAANHYGAFQNSLGFKVQAEQVNNPNMNGRVGRAMGMG
jgi:hypothetical protein